MDTENAWLEAPVIKFRYNPVLYRLKRELSRGLQKNHNFLCIFAFPMYIITLKILNLEDLHGKKRNHTRSGLRFAVQPADRAANP